MSALALLSIVDLPQVSDGGQVEVMGALTYLLELEVELQDTLTLVSELAWPSQHGEGVPCRSCF